jgi:hypothetical protein
MKILIALAAGLVLIGAAIVHAEQWPGIIEPYPESAKIDKPLAVTIDFSDDMWRSKAGVKTANIESLMEKLAGLGFNQVNWIICPERYLTAQAVSDADPRDGVRVAAEAAHRRGMRFYGLFKPFDTGCVNAQVPPAVKLPPNMPVIKTLTGRLAIFSPFLARHPDMCIEHRPVPDRSTQAVTTIKLVKQDDTPSRLDQKRIRLFVGERNGEFEPYPGPMKFADAVERRDGKPVRVLMLSDLSIGPKFRYLLIRTTFPEGGKGDFTNLSSRIIELYDRKGGVLPQSPSIKTLDRDTVVTILKNMWLDQTGRWGVPAEYELDPAYGKLPERTAYYFGPTPDSENDPLVTLDAPGGGLIADARGKDMYMTSLQPMYPQVRAYWLEQIKNLIDDGADGIILRVDNHSTWYTDPYDYGFNPPVVEAYKKKYGVDIRTHPLDQEKWRALQGDAYTQFVREARQLTKRRNVKLQLSINRLMGPAMPYWNLNNVPMSIQWQWKKWITEKLCDSVELKLIPWPWGHYGGSGADFAQEVIRLAHANEMPVWANARIETWWLTISDRKEAATNKLTQVNVGKIIERLRWVWRSRAIDGMIVYENFDFTYLDATAGESYISPAFQTIMENLRRGTAEGLKADKLKTFYLDQPSSIGN